MSEHRQKTNMSLATRSKNGDIADYLEVRRPFGAAEWRNEKESLYNPALAMDGWYLNLFLKL
jgi:hypothetical protein